MANNCSTELDHFHVVIPAKAITATVFVVSVIVPNLVVLVIIIHNAFTKKQGTVPRILMGALSIIDLTFGVMSGVPQVVNYWMGYCSAGGYATCLYLGYIQTFCLKSSQLLVVLMSLDRATALVLPFRYGSIWTVKTTFAMVFGVVFYVNLLSVLPFFGVNRYGSQSFCWFYWGDQTAAGKAYTIYFIAEGAATTVFLIGCNIAVIRELFKIHKAKGNYSIQETPQTEFIILMGLLSVLFIICNTPLMVRMAFNQLQINLSREADFLAMRFFITNSAVNAHLYWVLRLVVGKKIFTKARKKFRMFLNQHSATVEDLETQATTVSLAT